MKNTKFFACSEREQTLYEMMENDPQNPSYLLIGLHPLSGYIDTTVLNIIFNGVFSACDNLNASYIKQNNKLLKQFVSDVSYTIKEFQVVDCQAAIRDIEAYSEQGFDLAKAPLVRLDVFKDGNNNYVLVCQAHHLVVDGMSAAIIFTYIKALYNFVMRAEYLTRYLPFIGKPQVAKSGVKIVNFLKKIMLPNSAYLRFIASENKLLASHKKRELLNYLIEKKKQTNNGVLPKSAKQNGNYDETDVSSITFTLPDELFLVLKSLRQQYHLSAGRLLIAAYYIALWQWQACDTICLRIPHANRRCKANKFVVGYITNPLLVTTHKEQDDNLVTIANKFNAELTTLNTLNMPELSIARDIAAHDLLAKFECNYIKGEFDFSMYGTKIVPQKNVMHVKKTWHGKYYQVDLSVFINEKPSKKTIDMQFISRCKAYSAQEIQVLQAIYLAVMQQGFIDPELKLVDYQF